MLIIYTRRINIGVFNTHKTKCRRSMKNYSSGRLLRKFKKINWNELSDIDDVHKVKATFESTIDKITRVNEIRLRQKTGPCMTNAIFDVLRERDHSLYHLQKIIQRTYIEHAVIFEIESTKSGKLMIKKVKRFFLKTKSMNINVAFLINEKR